MSDENNVLVNEEGELLVHEDNLLQTAQPQDGRQALYATKIVPQEAKIDWSCDTDKLDCLIRAFTPFPGAWCPGPKGRLRILKARPTDLARPANVPAGSIVSIGKATLHVATGNGVLAIEKLQLAGKKPMHVADFLIGHKLVIGQILAAPTA